MIPYVPLGRKVFHRVHWGLEFLDKRKRRRTATGTSDSFQCGNMQKLLMIVETDNFLFSSFQNHDQKKTTRNRESSGNDRKGILIKTLPRSKILVTLSTKTDRKAYRSKYKSIVFWFVKLFKGHQIHLHHKNTQLRDVYHKNKYLYSIQGLMHVVNKETNVKMK
jgi:hypothetical protein